MALRGREIFGFQSGLAQPSVTIDLAFGCPREEIRFSRLDQWLEDVLGIDLVPPVVVCDLRGDQFPIPYLWRLMLIAQAIRQAARIPVFDGGRILEVRPDPKGSLAWHARITVPQIDAAPIDITRSAFDVAAKLLFGLSRRSDALPDTKPLLDWVQEHIVKPSHAMLPLGISPVPILEAAHRKGIPYRHLGGGIYQLGWGSRRRVIQLSAVDTDSAVGGLLSGQKQMAATVFNTAGLPAPRHLKVNDEQSAIAAATEIGWPVVIKPADRNRSEGVTVGLSNSQAVAAAFRVAAKLSRVVLVEEQYSGDCYRLFISNGKLLYATRRRPIAVFGDGKHTIAELAQAHNQQELSKAPWLRGKLMPVDQEAHSLLSSMGLNLGTVPDESEYIPFRNLESGRWGGLHTEATADVHPANIAIAVRAAEVCGLYNVGVDILSSDISRPWYETGAVINEVNFGPALGLSEASRSHIPAYIESLVVSGGRIPIEAYVGNDEAMGMAKARQSDLLAEGVSCYLTSQSISISSEGDIIHMASSGLIPRTLALLMNAHVEALIIVVQESSDVEPGLPVDQISKVTVADSSAGESEAEALSDAIDMLKRIESGPV